MMSRTVPAVVSATSALLCAATLMAPAAGADDEFAPPFIDHTQWAKWGDLSSLRVYPTPTGREAAGTFGTGSLGDEAWTEVLAMAPEADLPGMRDQFKCHWYLAEFGAPGKTSWNLKPWRPVVDIGAMLEAGCNPGGSEEPF